MSAPRRRLGRRSATVFAALGEPHRLRIVGRLSDEGPLSITRLSAGTNVSRQAITKHLAVLADAGLVRDRREGRERIFELAPEPLAHARHDLDAISARWDRAIDRLRLHVEG